MEVFGQLGDLSGGIVAISGPRLRRASERF